MYLNENTTQVWRDLFHYLMGKVLKVFLSKLIFISRHENTLIRFSSIGDIVLTSPIIRYLKQQLANSEVHYLTKAMYQEMLTANPYLSKVWAIKK